MALKHEQKNGRRELVGNEQDVSLIIGTCQSVYWTVIVRVKHCLKGFVLPGIQAIFYSWANFYIWMRVRETDRQTDRYAHDYINKSMYIFLIFVD